MFGIGSDKIGKLGFYKIGGEGGIRTLDTRLTYTHFPGVRFQPLTHFTIFRRLSIADTV